MSVIGFAVEAISDWQKVSAPKSRFDASRPPPLFWSLTFSSTRSAVRPQTSRPSRS